MLWFLISPPSEEGERAGSCCFLAAEPSARIDVFALLSSPGSDPSALPQAPGSGISSTVSACHCRSRNLIQPSASTFLEGVSCTNLTPRKTSSVPHASRAPCINPCICSDSTLADGPWFALNGVFTLPAGITTSILCTKDQPTDSTW